MNIHLYMHNDTKENTKEVSFQLWNKSSKAKTLPDFKKRVYFDRDKLLEIITEKRILSKEDIHLSVVISDKNKNALTTAELTDIKVTRHEHFPNTVTLYFTTHKNITLKVILRVDNLVDPSEIIIKDMEVVLLDISLFDKFDKYTMEVLFNEVEDMYATNPLIKIEFMREKRNLLARIFG